MKTILVMTDFSERARHAAEVALQIAEKTNSKIMLYHLFTVPNFTPAEAAVYPYFEEYSATEEEANLQLERLAKEMSVRGASGTVQIDYTGRPFGVDDIFEPFEKKQIWLIVMGDKSREGALSDFIWGSETTRVTEKAFCPVLLVPPAVTDIPMRCTIAFASELSTTDETVLREAANFAKIFDGRILVVHIAADDVSESTSLKHSEAFANMAAGIDDVDISFEEIEGGKVSEALSVLTHVGDIQILALIHHRYSFIKRLFHTSITRQMLNYHDAMLLVYPDRKGQQ